MRWSALPDGVRQIGHDGAGFAFDNERPRHRVFVGDCELAERLVTNAEYRAFIDDGGYRQPELWLSEGWDVRRRRAGRRRSTGCDAKAAGASSRSKARARSSRTSR